MVLGKVIWVLSFPRQAVGDSDGNFGGMPANCAVGLNCNEHRQDRCENTQIDVQSPSRFFNDQHQEFVENFKNYRKIVGAQPASNTLVVMCS